MFKSLAHSFTSSLHNIIEALHNKFHSSEEEQEVDEEEQQPEKESEETTDNKEDSIEKARAEQAKRQNALFSTECRQIQREYTNMKGIVERLSDDYDNAKRVNYFSRYGRLKGMIKRTINDVKLKVNDDQNKENTIAEKKTNVYVTRPEHPKGLTTDEILEENEQLQQQIKEYKRKMSMIEDLIDIMESSYENCKRYIIFQRYRLMKTMIKTVIRNRWI